MQTREPCMSGYKVFWDFKDAQGRLVQESSNAVSVRGTQSEDIPITASRPSDVQATVIASSNIPDPARLAIHTEALYKDAFFSILTDRYFLFGKTFELDAHDTPNICSGWMTYALASGKDKTILSEILLALSSVVVAADLQDPSISENSRRRYQRAISGISQAIEAHNSAANSSVISESMLMTCLACAKYELVANKSLLNMARHISGLGALFQRRGVQGINTVCLRELYCECRPTEISICLTASRDSVFSLDIWRNPPWKVYYSAAAAPLQHLLDIAFGLPPLLEKWKNAKLNSLQTVACQSRHPESQDSMSTAGMTDLLREMLQIHDDLYTWHEAFWKTHQRSLQIAMQSSTWENIHFDPAEVTEGKLFSTSYTFSHFPTAMASIYYDGIRIQLFKNADEICTELAARSENSTNSGFLGSQDQYIATLSFLRGDEIVTSINRVLQCAEYFLDKDKKLVGPTTYMFAFHVSFSALCRLRKINPRGAYRRQIRLCRLISAKYEEARLASLTSLDIGKLIGNFIEMSAFDISGCG